MSATTAGMYYKKAMDNLNEGNVNEAVRLFGAAAIEYSNAIPKADKVEKKFLQRMYDNCIAYMRQLSTPKKDFIKEGESNQMYTFKVEYPSEGFERVAGMQQLKEKIHDSIILPLTEPEFKKYLDVSNNGIIMYGPPGVGKTYIAKSTAGEASKTTKSKVGFIYVRASDLKRGIVGETEQNIRKMFEVAAENSPVILFLDEIQALCSSRGSEATSAYDKNFLTELLMDFDIIEGKDVLVLGATNYPYLLDPALFREGRFGDTIFVEPPDLEARVELLKMYLGTKPHEQIDLNELAVILEDYSPADIKKISNDAWTKAYKSWKRGERKNPSITQTDLVDLISNTEPSIYIWVDVVANQLKSGSVNHYFAEEMERFIHRINKRRGVSE
jgi:transitional endoplasmic reticulum ATPase